MNSATGTGLKRADTNLPGAWEILFEPRGDARGSFLETYHQKKFAELGITDVFVQDNHSVSAQGVLRGLHYQLHRPQAKLCRVIEGEALDVAVDIRVGSPHFGKWASVVLSAEKRNQLYVPRGFAHGFLALSPRVQFLYKCSDFYDGADEHGIAFNDPDLNIAWGTTSPLLSEKDKHLPPLANVPRELLPRY
ncbi:MAG TPA: dTDP-4-dehydrorhamnose 3,5-epimerase [Candidatus Acidoferrales bacterium]|nr:dTDP-4-dehydrorhamnose 3,5-epimerase [Candidatus Acidoferrales bacterium]